MVELNPKTQPLLSVVVRFHNGGNTQLLSEALFSLACQEYENLEVILVVKNMDPRLSLEIDEILKGCPWHPKMKTSVVRASVASNEDGRSYLLNLGIQNATGEFLAFLDYDDVIYQHGYKLLMGEAANPKYSDRALFAGGCRVATLKKYEGHWMIDRKDMPFSWGKYSFDLLRDNFIPIHSYVLKLENIPEEVLCFNEELDRLEDYEFLLRLLKNCSLQLKALKNPICEYRLRIDGGNSSIVHGESSDTKKKLAWEKARAYVTDHCIEFQMSVDSSQLLELQRQAMKYREIEIKEVYIFWQDMIRVLRPFPRLKELLYSCFLFFLFFFKNTLSIYRKRNLSNGETTFTEKNNATLDDL